MNILYGYAYGVKYFHGDHTDSCQEFVNLVQLLAQNLSGRNFDHADLALESAASEVNNHQHLAISLKFSREVKQDVLEIVRGPTGADNFYILSALSDLIELFRKCIKKLKSKEKDEKEPNKEGNLPAWFKNSDRNLDLNIDSVKKNVKKFEFYLSWTQDHYQELNEYFH